MLNHEIDGSSWNVNHMSTMYSTPECPGEITLSSERGISHIYFQSAVVKAKLILHFSQMYIIISYTFHDSYLWY